MLTLPFPSNLALPKFNFLQVSYLQTNIKVQNKKGNLGNHIKVAADGNNLSVSCKGAAFSKRYLKYLTKKYLKKQQLRDWLRILGTSKSNYELRYYNISQGEDAAAEEAKDE